MESIPGLLRSFLKYRLGYSSLLLRQEGANGKEEDGREHRINNSKEKLTIAINNCFTSFSFRFPK